MQIKYWNDPKGGVYIACKGNETAISRNRVNAIMKLLYKLYGFNNINQIVK